ncbi:MAG: hypothetical protein J7530_13905 [Novosphingobium sp.]|nr:hypothetical protein [Novosphingobium sp.]
MSDDRRPARVRVFSSGTPDASSQTSNPDPQNLGQNNPGRRRTDAPQLAANDAEGGKSGGRIWVVLGALLFLIGCALGGVLFTISVLHPGALL